MSEPSRREQVAYEVVRRILGAEVEHHDTQGRQGVVDALIHFGSGHSAALEVTTLTDRSAHEVEQLLGAEDFAWELPGCAWGWTVQIPPGSRIKRIREDLPRLVQWCEAFGVADPNVRAYIRDLPGASEWSDWLDATGVRVYGHPESTTFRGKAMVLPSSKGGAVGDLTAVASWLEAELQSDRCNRKVAKLLASGYGETHLFLIIDDTGAPFAGFYALAFGDGMPDSDPDIAGLTAVWLAPRWSPTVLKYDIRLGWSRHQPYDEAHS